MGKGIFRRAKDGWGPAALTVVVVVASSAVASPQSHDGAGAAVDAVGQWVEQPVEQWVERWSGGDAADRAAVESALTQLPPRRLDRLRQIACGGGESAATARRLWSYVLAAPHPVDAFDLDLLSRFDVGPQDAARQIELRDELWRFSGDERVWPRLAPLLQHSDPRVRARGAYLIRGHGSQPAPIAVQARWATDPWVRWDGVHVDLDDRTAMRVLGPAIHARGPPAIPAELARGLGELPALSGAARRALREAMEPWLFAVADGSADPGGRSIVAQALVRLGAGVRELRAARIAGRRDVLLALLDVARDDWPPDPSLRGELVELCASEDVAVAARALGHVTAAEQLPGGVWRRLLARARAIAARGTCSLGPVPAGRRAEELRWPGWPRTPDGVLLLMACRLGGEGLLEPLEADFVARPLPANEDSEAGRRAAFTCLALAEIAPSVDELAAGRLFDLLVARLPLRTDGWPERSAVSGGESAALDALLAVLPRMPDDRLDRLASILSRPGATGGWLSRLQWVVDRCPAPRAGWLFERWPPGLALPVAVAAGIPERLVAELVGRGPRAATANVALRALASLRPELLVSWSREGRVPEHLLAGVVAGLPEPDPELLPFITDRVGLVSATQGRVIDRLDPVRDRPVLETLVAGGRPDVAARAAVVLTRGGGAARSRGLAVLEELAEQDFAELSAVVMLCMSAGIESDRVLAAARVALRESDAPAVFAAALWRAGVLSEEELLALPTQDLLRVLRISGVGLDPALVAGRREEIVEFGQQDFAGVDAPRVQELVLECARGDEQAMIVLHLLPLWACASADPDVRKAAYRLFAASDPRVFPVAVIAGEALLDDDPDVRAAGRR